MGTVGWLLMVAVGIVLGYGIGRTWPGTAAKAAELQRERDAAREELREYRKDVSTHFERTAALFDKVTADYQGLYEHLAVGARRLSAIRGEPDDASLAEPALRRLAEPAETAARPQLEPVEQDAPEKPEVAKGRDAPEQPGAPEETDAPKEPATAEEPVAPEADKPPKDATG